MTGTNLPESGIDFQSVSDGELKTWSNPLNAHRHAANESLIVEIVNLLKIAPDQYTVFPRKLADLRKWAGSKINRKILENTRKIGRRRK